MNSDSKADYAYALVVKMLASRLMSRDFMLMPEPDVSLLADTNIPAQVFARVALDDLYGAKFENLGLSEYVLERIDYEALLTTAQNLFVSIANDDTFTPPNSIKIQKSREPLTRDQRIALLSIIISAAIGIAGLMQSAKSEPSITNNISYQQTIQQDPSEAIKKYIDDIIRQAEESAPEDHDTQSPMPGIAVPDDISPQREV